MLSQEAGYAKTNGPRTNWAQSYRYRASGLAQPQTLEEVCSAVIGRAGGVKALGAGHSFHGIADTRGEQISLEHLDSMELDRTAHTVTVGGGVRYGVLAAYLGSRGYALHNLASLAHVTVAGACATATHGSGSSNGNLATAVSAIEMVTAAGDVVRLSRDQDGERFLGAVVGLGALGVVTSLTLTVVPAFAITQTVYEGLPFAQMERHLEDIFASGYSVSLFTDWQRERATQVWVKRRWDADANARTEPEFFGARAARQPMHPLPGHSAENCTEQHGGTGTLVRPSATFPHGLHAEQRAGAAD